MQANISAAHNLGSAPGGVICQRTLDWGEPLPEWFQREVIEQDGPQPLPDENLREWPFC